MTASGRIGRRTLAPGVQKQVQVVTVQDREISLVEPDQLLWPELGVTKLGYMQYLLTVAPYLLPHTRNRMLMMWYYPHGINGKRIEKRERPPSAPDWLTGAVYKDKPRIFLNDVATLCWVASYGALELHVPFDMYQKPNYPTALVFDLDPSEPADFALVLEVALKLHHTLNSLGLTSVAKTSGATGLQIYVPVKPQYTFEQTRKLNKFVADYMLQQMPDKITVDRVVVRRGTKLYFDYLQLWKGRTMPPPYSVRARPWATVSTPVTWAEVEKGFEPESFTVKTVPNRLAELGDLFHSVAVEHPSQGQSLDDILRFLQGHDVGTN